MENFDYHVGVKRKYLRDSLQLGLGLNRMFYGFVASLYAFFGLLSQSGVAKSLMGMDELGSYGQFLCITMMACALILVLDGIVSLAVVVFPDVKVINAICNLANRSRTWCFVPISFCFFGFAFLTAKDFLLGNVSSVAVTCNILLSLFGLAFSLHENVIVNEKNRYKENVCLRD